METIAPGLDSENDPEVIADQAALAEYLGNQSGSELQPESEIKARTREQARQLPNFPSDELLEGFIRLHQDPAILIKSYGYLISHEASPADCQALTPTSGAAHHRKLASLISRKLRIRPSASGLAPEARSAIAAGLNDYVSHLSTKVETIEARAGGQDYPTPDDPDLRLDGLRLSIAGQERGLSDYFLLDSSCAANMHIANKSFTWYGTESYSQSLFDGKEKEVTDRIYLNPEIDQTVDVFEDLIDIFEANRVDVRLKVFNWAIAAGDRPPGRVRSEGITVYSSAGEVDRILALILDYYQSNPEAFAERPAPPLATEVAPGIGIATQEGFDGNQYSFNSHRAEVFDQAWHLLQQSDLDPDMPLDRQVANFKYVLKWLCVQEDINIDPNNIAFPGPATTGQGAG